MRRRQHVARREHQQTRLGLRLRRQRHVDGHLVAVEVGVEREADERVDLDRLALDEDRLEGLDAETVQRRCAVEHHRVIGDDLLEHVPHLRTRALDHPLRGLDVRREVLVDEPLHDERLEQLERHDLRQTALVQVQVRTDDDHRTARVVDALAEQVLTEPSLLALEHVGQRLERTVARPGHRTSAAAVVEQRVDGLLEHPLLVVDDDLGRAEVEQPLQPVVAVDHAAVEVVEVGRREPATVELHHRTQVRRDDRDRVEDHRRRLVARLHELLEHLQSLDRADPALALVVLDRRAEELLLVAEVERAEEVLDGLGPHAAAEVLAVGVAELAPHVLGDELLRRELARTLPTRGP